MASYACNCNMGGAYKLPGPKKIGVQEYRPEASIGHLIVDIFWLSQKIKKSSNIKYQVENYVYMSYVQNKK